METIKAYYDVIMDPLETDTLRHHNVYIGDGYIMTW